MKKLFIYCLLTFGRDCSRSAKPKLVWQCSRLFAALSVVFCLLSAFAQSDSLKWDFTDIFQGTKETPALPSSLEGWKQHLELFGRNIPQEEVFLHLDNTCYFAGDTLYFKAYVRRSDTGKLTDLSQLLYAELWNQEGYML